MIAVITGWEDGVLVKLKTEENWTGAVDRMRQTVSLGQRKENDLPEEEPS
jgi:hypothetical protein